MMTTLVVAVLAVTTSPLPAAKPAESLTPKRCEEIGISVRIRHQGGALHHGVTVKIDKRAERFQKDFVPRVEAIAHRTPISFSIPVRVSTDFRGNRVMTFSMTRELLSETRLWLDDNAYIALQAHLDPAAAR